MPTSVSAGHSGPSEAKLGVLINRPSTRVRAHVESHLAAFVASPDPLGLGITDPGGGVDAGEAIAGRSLRLTQVVRRHYQATQQVAPQVALAPSSTSLKDAALA